MNFNLYFTTDFLSQNLETPQTEDGKPGTPFGERTDGTESVAKFVEEVVYGVKTAVDGAIAWAEKKADDLSSEKDNVGPYASPATCVPSDLDVIGVLPDTPAQQKTENTDRDTKEGKEDEKERNDSVSESSS